MPKLQVKVLDELGLVLSMQDNALCNYARYVAMHDRGVNSMLQAGQLYAPIKRFSFAKVFQRVKTHGSLPNQKIEASYDIVEYQQSQTKKMSKLDKDQHRQDEMQTIQNECELLNVAFEVARKFRKHVKLKFEIIVTSSEIVDAILDECKIPLRLRHAVI